MRGRFGNLAELLDRRDCDQLFRQLDKIPFRGDLGMSNFVNHVEAGDDLAEYAIAPCLFAGESVFRRKWLVNSAWRLILELVHIRPAIE